MPGFVSNTIQAHLAAYSEEEGDYLFLILKRAADRILYPNLWQAVTGEIEEGETALQTTIREIKEETGLKPLEMWTVPYMTTFFDAGRDLVNASPVFGALVEHQPEIKLSSEHRDYLWLNYEDCLKKLELPSHKEGLKVFWEYILNQKDKETYRIIMK